VTRGTKLFDLKKEANAYAFNEDSLKMHPTFLSAAKTPGHVYERPGTPGFFI